MGKFKLVKDFSGEILRLTLVLKEEFKDKDYDLYNVCKIVKNENDEEEVIPLYSETFTPDQVEAFYNKPTYYATDLQEEYYI